MNSELIGGIGLFLVGMMLTTDGLRAAAGDQLRTTLLRFTGGPYKALLTGAVVTALVQSSSVTTVAAIGFVGAGLLTFRQSLSLIFGANIGTTATGWLVASVGLKLDISSLALPLVGVGALLRLFARGRTADLSLALAGFGLIFVGVGVMQQGMGALTGLLTPQELPGDTFGGRLLLMGIGIILTSVMQSSSAAVATTLTALHSGGISLQQAAAMVIGANIGTTVTAGLAAIGASTSAKRTALAHLMFNVVTGVTAFGLLPLFVALSARVGSELGPGDAATALAAFHTVFNAFGVLLVFPFAGRFASFVERVIPERGPHLTRHLDVNATHIGGLAIEAVRQTALEMAHEVFSALLDMLREKSISKASQTRLESVASAETEVVQFMSQLRGEQPPAPELRRRHASTLHALDHIERLLDVAVRLDESVFSDAPPIRDLSRRLQHGLEEVIAWTGDPTQDAPLETVRALSEHLAEARKALRPDVLDRTARGTLSPLEAGKHIEASRRLDELGYYVWRITEHLKGERLRTPG
jgi:phosphate:Na+ symporter